jgi:hypothetical protein
MEQDELDKAVQQAYTRRRTVHWMLQSVCVIFVLMLMIVQFLFRSFLFVTTDIDTNVFSFITCCSIPLIVILVGAMWLNWRCPVCDSYFGRLLDVQFCSTCGTKLQ